MLQQKYASQPEAIASYDYTDIADGTGVRNFYLTAEVNTTESYKLTNNSDVYSNTIEYARASKGNGAASKILDVDFDLTTFVTSQIIKGTALVSLGGYLVGDYGDTTGYYIVRVRKYSSSTESEVAYGTSETFRPAAGGDKNTKVHGIYITIPETLYAVGDILRVTIEGWVANAGAGTSYMTFGMDPMNRDGTYIIPSTDSIPSITSSRIKIPFRILN